MIIIFIWSVVPYFTTFNLLYPLIITFSFDEGRAGKPQIVM